MKLFTMDDLSYNGVHQGVHRWDHPESGDPYYWHPEWLHIAEDAMGLYPKRNLNVPEGRVANEEHAKQAIVDHLNDRES